MAITSALSALNSLHDQVKETGENVGGLLQKAMDVTTGIHRYEIEARDSIVSPDPSEIMRIIAEKRKIERFNENLRLLGNLNREAGKYVDDYFAQIEEAKRAHAASIRAIQERKKQRARIMKEIATYSLVVITGLFGAVIVVTLFIAWMRY